MKRQFLVPPLFRLEFGVILEHIGAFVPPRVETIAQGSHYSVDLCRTKIKRRRLRVATDKQTSGQTDRLTEGQRYHLKLSSHYVVIGELHWRPPFKLRSLLCPTIDCRSSLISAHWRRAICRTDEEALCMTGASAWIV